MDFKAIQCNLKINAMQLMQRIKRLCESDMNQIKINQIELLKGIQDKNSVA